MGSRVRVQAVLLDSSEVQLALERAAARLGLSLVTAPDDECPQFMLLGSGGPVETDGQCWLPAPAMAQLLGLSGSRRAARAYLRQLLAGGPRRSDCTTFGAPRRRG